MRQNEIILGDCREVAVLFARADSVYKEIPGTDVWDIHRDAMRWPGGSPVVAHPPCRAWASLRHCAKPRAGEKDLAFLAIRHVRRYGGVLEHPQLSTLWKVASLPEIGNRDEYGGWTLIVDQQWFGHRARKRTKLYIVGCSPHDIPTMPMVLSEATHTVGLWSGRDKQKARPSIRKSEFEATPREFAIWLCEVARRAGDVMERIKSSMTTHPATAEALKEILRVTAKEWRLENDHD